MKRILLNITWASLATLVAYIILYFIWGALLSGIDSPKIRLFIISGMTSLVYAFFLLYWSKIRKDVGEEEVMSDYSETSYTSWRNDICILLKNEWRCIVSIWSVIILCFALNSIDGLMFDQKVISLPTFFYTPMTIFATCFEIEIFGYILSALIISVAYLCMLLIYRKKRYDYWMKNK